MKQKFTYLLFLLTFSILIGIGSIANAQSVSGTPSTTGCSGGGTITASSTGLGATPQYQLLLGSTVVLPDAANPITYTNSPIFSGLASGSYTLKARKDAVGAIYTSATIIVANGYTNMTVATPTKGVSCATGTTDLTTTITGGKSNYTYSISLQGAPVGSPPLQTSGAITASTYTFNAMPIGNYLVSVTDNCGNTVTGATNVSLATVSITNIKPYSTVYLLPNGGVGNCSSPLAMVVEGGWVYASGGSSVSTSDAALFTWKIKYQGVLYGKDVTGDGYSDAAGGGIPLTSSKMIMPLVATRAGIIADYANMRIVVSDLCGNTKEFTVWDYNGGSSNVSSVGSCSGTPIIRAFLGAGMACLPLDITFTNSTNPADKVTFNVNSGSTSFLGTGLTPGQTYNLTYLDASNYTTNVYKTTSITIPSTSSLSVAQYAINVNQYNLNLLGYAQANIVISPALPTDMISYTITSSDNPSIPIGYNSSKLYGNPSGGIFLNTIKASDPVNYWPKGNYVLTVTTPCGVVKNVKLTIGGYTANLTGYSTTPICGGFSYVMNGVFGDGLAGNLYSAFEVVMLSPGGGTQKRDMANSTSSLPFDGLTPGTYTFALRIKGGTTNVLTQTVVYDATSVITIDKANTGGFVCNAGATNGELNITASSASPGTGSILQYAISLDGGATYSAYQSSNKFPNLSSGTYSFRVKDGCNNEVTNTAQIGVAATPTATANGLASTAQVCKTVGGTMVLNVDVVGSGVTYAWNGPGISNTPGDPAFKGLKSPGVNLDGLTTGIQNYSVSVLNPFCSATPAVSNLTVNINALPIATIAYPTTICKSDAATSVTLTGQTGGIYSALPSGLTINAATGAVTPSSSTAGTYIVTYTFTNGTCPSTTTTSVTINALPASPTVSATQPSCGTPTGSISITGVSGETYSVDGTSYSATLTYLGLTPGSHNIVSKSVGGCISSATIIKINAAPLLPNAPTVLETQPVCGTPTGSITITGVTGETYSLDGSAYTSTLTYSGLTSGSHTITAKSVDGCISTPTTITIAPAKTEAVKPVVAITAQPVCGTPTGSITITGVTGETYSLDGSAYTSTLMYSGLTPGSHTILAKSVDGCISAPTTITIAPAKTEAVKPVVAITAQPVCGEPTGSITITSVAGEIYSVDGSAYTSTLTYSGLTPGSHTILAKSVDGCISAPTTITIAPAKTEAVKPVVAITAQPVCGTPTGSITITGVTGETYNLDGSAYTSTLTYSGLTSGSHTIISKSVDGCTSTPTTITIAPAKTEALKPVVAITAQPVCSTPTGSITITGVTGETYSLDGSAYTSTLTYSGLTPGSHTILAKSVDGCISTSTTITISSAKTEAVKPVVAITAQPVCGTPTGSITITGVTGETYNLDGSAYTSTLTYSGLTSGSHTIISKSVDGCTSTPTTITIAPAKTAAVKPVVAITAQPVCGEPTGSITITSVAGEIYSVDGSAYTSTLTYSGLTPGSHTILAKSVDGCISAPTTITIAPAKTEALKPVVAITAQPVCGTPTGSITITGVTGETYSLDGSAYTSTLMYSGLTPGSHTILAKSVDGCISTSTTITISSAKTEAVKPVVAITAQPVCGTPTGSITITGVTGETYNLDGSAYTSTLTYSGLTSGSHTIISKSVDGCTSTPTTITIAPAKTEALKPVVAITAQPVCSTPTGSITITGVTGETYSLDGSAYTSTLTYSGLTSGSHTIISKSVDGCTSTPTTITIAPAKTAAVKPVVAITAQPVCGEPTGSITITSAAGEIYSVDGSAYTSTLTYSGLTPGSHTILAKSVDGCISAPTIITIAPAKTEALKPVVAITAQPVCGTPTGSITITGVTGETYSLDGSAYTSTLMYSGLTPGSHTILAKSVDGCISAPTTITISPAKTEVVKPVVAITAQPVCGTPTGSITITGVTGETYSLDGSAYTSTLTYSGLIPGLHTVTAKSVDGCTSTPTTITIAPAKTEAVKPVVAITAQPVCGEPTGSITITGATGETYSLDGSAYTSTLTYSGLTPGSHTILAKSIDGCISAPTTITIAPAKTEAVKPVVAITAQPVCGTPTGSITITAVTSETYSLDGSTYTSTLTYSGLIPGSHTVTAKSVDGCTSTPTTITIAPAKTAAVKPVVAITAQPVCGEPTGSITITGVTGETYNLDGSAYTSTLTYSGLTPGSHTILAKSVDGCISTATNITISPAKVNAVKPVVTLIAQPSCSLATGSIIITAVTGETYSIDGSAYTSTLAYSGLTSGSHTITAKSVDGCISNSTDIIINMQPAAPTASISYGAVQFQAAGTALVSQSGQLGGSYSSSPSGLSINTSTGTINLAESTPNQTYVITYAFSNGTCSGTAATSVRINATPAVITYAKPAYCANGTADIIRTGTANGTYTASGNGLKINATTGTINLGASSEGNYTVTYTYQDGTITAQATTLIIVNAMPVVSVVSDLGADISRGDFVTLTATGGITYSWSGDDIQGAQNTNVLRIRPKQTSTYTVTATNASGCSDMVRITIHVTDDLKLEPNNVITPNGDGKNDTWIVKNLDYYPNNKVAIYDRAGRKVYGASNYNNDWDGNYNGQPLAEGAYIYVIDLGKEIGLLRGTISIIRDNR